MRKYIVIADINGVTEFVYEAKDIDHAEVAVDIFSDSFVKHYKDEPYKAEIRINIVEV